MENARYDAKVHNFAYKTSESLKLVLKYLVVLFSYMNNCNMNLKIVIMTSGKHKTYRINREVS